MLRIAGALSATALPLLPSAAHAHFGHFGDIAGHTHWAGAAAVGAAAVVAGIVAIRDRRKKDTAEDPGTDNEEKAEAA